MEIHNEKNNLNIDLDKLSSIEEQPKPKVKKKRNCSATIEIKKQIIADYESGIRIARLSEKYGLVRTTIFTIIKNREKIKAAKVAKGIRSINRSVEMEEVERLLLPWITDKIACDEKITKTTICETAKNLYKEITKNNVNAEIFKASNGWFEKFKKRTNNFGQDPEKPESENSIEEPIENYESSTEETAYYEGYSSEQVFNCYKISLYWKRMSRKTFLFKEEKAIVGRHSMNDKLNLLFCGNASGDLKIKPLLIYHSEYPRSFKRKKVNKNQLNVLWRVNPRKWITRQLFSEWFEDVFAPTVKQYLESNNLPQKAILVFNNAPSHLIGIEKDLNSDYHFIEIRFITGTRNLRLIRNFRKTYTKLLFQTCFDAVTNKKLDLREFWKNDFDLYESLKILDKTVDQVCLKTTDFSWGTLWSVSLKDSEQPKLSLEDEIMQLGSLMGLEVDKSDILDLVQEVEEIEPTPEELYALTHQETMEKAGKNITSESLENGSSEEISMSDLRELIGSWYKIQNIIEKWHPRKELVNTNIEEFDENVIRHFKNILRQREDKRKLSI